MKVLWKHNLCLLCYRYQANLPRATTKFYIILSPPHLRRCWLQSSRNIEILDHTRLHATNWRLSIARVSPLEEEVLSFSCRTLTSYETSAHDSNNPSKENIP